MSAISPAWPKPNAGSRHDSQHDSLHDGIIAMALFTIPPHAPFLPTLAGAVMDGRLLGDWPRQGPFWLSDIVIVVPTQRARQVLAEAFADHEKASGLLPDIRTFGGEAEDEEPFLEPFLDPRDAPPLPPPASLLRRRLVLSRLVAAWAHSPAGAQAFASPPGAGEILSMADSLGRVFDDLAIEERGAADLKAIGAEIGPHLGAYWQQSLIFLDIALNAWPQILAAAGLADPATLRRARLDRQAAAAPRLYGDKPVIAAGSTGSIPATARLLRAIARLPRGALVLPGLDSEMGPGEHAALLDPQQGAHGHGHYHLARLLHTLGARPDQAIALAPSDNARTLLVNRALALTAQTAQWAEHRLDADQLAAAESGLSIIAARHEDEEARAIAMAARAGLAEGRSVGIITPDRNLARRIAAELARFAIVIDDAAGVPLFHSTAGRLARQLLTLVVNSYGAPDLVALLRNRACVFDLGRAEITALADALELRLLRGRRLAPGLAGLRAALCAHSEAPDTARAPRLSAEKARAIAGLFDRLETALGPLAELLTRDRLDATSLGQALWHAFEAVSAGAPVRGRPEMARWAEAMAGLAGEGHLFPPRGLDSVLSALMSGFQVRSPPKGREDIAIWGRLEARLMRPDLAILGALNEDKWPEPADPGPWLSRGMRLAAGLDPPERLHGLAAHDFMQAMGNAQVIMTYAERVGASPATPSRFVQRLDGFMGREAAHRLRQRGQIWLDQARAIDAVAQTRRAQRPLPNPPAHLRPRRLSVTEIETLMRSPYDLYARHVLGLKRIDPLGELPDARERGTLVHAALARFVSQGHDPLAANAHDVLMAIAADSFSGLEAIGERRDIWLHRFSTMARQFLDFERTRAPLVRQRHAEIGGRMALALAEPFILTGQADRIDEMQDGTVEIIDFKTGSPPSKAMMSGFEAPQLLVEALMVRAGAMIGSKAKSTDGSETGRAAGIAPAPVGALTYIKIGLGPEAFRVSPFTPPPGMDLTAAADEIGRRLQGHVEFFLFRQTPMPARLLPLTGQRFAGAYDHLARFAEWSEIDGGEQEE